MRSPSLKRGALALSLATLTTILAAPVAAAGQSEEIAEVTETCPIGWSEINDADSSTDAILLFCEQDLDVDGFDPPDKTVFVKVRADHVTQGYQYLTGGEQEFRPVLKSTYVRKWLDIARNSFDANAMMAINGTYFDPYPEGQTPPLDYHAEQGRTSFPFYSGWTGTGANGLVSTGKPPISENPPQRRNRQCMSWRSSTNSTVKYGKWSISSDDYYWVLGGMRETEWCNIGAGEEPDSDAELLVGFSPWFDIPDGGIADSVTLVGVTTTGSGGPENNTLCFMVGGYYETTVQASEDMLYTFGCTPTLQLDGGHSSQLSYFDTEGYLHSPVFGYDWHIGAPNRNVPHILLVK